MIAAYQRKPVPYFLQYDINKKNRLFFSKTVIKTGSLSFPVNRWTFLCFCLFLEAKSKLKTGGSNKQEASANVENIHENALKNLVTYAYTGKISISSNNVLNILNCANDFKLNEVKRFCLEFLQKFLTINDCFLFLKTAKQYEDLALINYIYEYISKTWKTITESESLKHVSYNEFFEHASQLKQQFNVSDNILFQLIKTWMKYQETTQNNLLELFLLLDITRLSSNFVKDLIFNKLIPETSDLYKLLYARWKLLIKTGTRILTTNRLKQETSVNVLYNIDLKKNTNYPNMAVSLYERRLLKLNQVLYCIGSTVCKPSPSSKNFKMDMNNREWKWEKISKLNETRFDFSAAVFDDTLVVGGGRMGKTLTKFEAYNANTCKWTPISSLQEGRSGNELVVSQGCLFALGGCDGKNFSSSVERLEKFDGPWRFVSSMQKSRSWFAAVDLDGEIYVTGGMNNDDEALKSVEKYNAATDRWQSMNDLNIARYWHSACAMHGSIFIAGGRNGRNESVKEIECYDPILDKWEIVGSSENELYAHSLIVL